MPSQTPQINMTKNLFSACCMWGRHRILGMDNFKPTELSRSIGEISQVSIGLYHCSVVTKSGELFTFGSNKSNNLTHHTTTIPTEVNLKNVKQTECGDNFTVALTNEGEVYTWGSAGGKHLWSHIMGKRHCLGIETKSDIKIPTKINTPEEISQIVCGREHCLALGKFGVYSWGINDSAQLGEGSLYGNLQKPTLISILNEKQERIVKVFAAQYSSAALTDKGKIYVWGGNNEGQLGLNEDNLFQGWPRPLPLTEVYTVKDLYLGANTMMVLTETNEIFVAGMNVWKRMTKFTIPDGLEPEQVCCGEDYFAVLCKGGQITNYGGNFSINPEPVELPDSLAIVSPEFLPGRVLKLEGKYGYMAAITEVE